MNRLSSGLILLLSVALLVLIGIYINDRFVWERRWQEAQQTVATRDQVRGLQEQVIVLEDQWKALYELLSRKQLFTQSELEDVRGGITSKDQDPH